MRYQVEGSPLSPLVPRILAHLYCFIFGHDVPCGTGGGLCQRCYKVMALLQEKDGTFNVDGGMGNPLAFSLKDIFTFFMIRAKYKLWIRR